MMLAAGKGSTVIVDTEGERAEEAAAALQALIASAKTNELIPRWLCTASRLRQSSAPRNPACAPMGEGDKGSPALPAPENACPALGRPGGGAKP
jgi:hypothetical protein